MTTDEALHFLSEHQPLPPTAEIEDALIQQFNEVRQHFAANRDERCVPLLLNAFGQGDGHGVYQLVEDVLLQYPKAAMVPALIEALANPRGGVRYWSAQISAHYSDQALVAPLLEVLRVGDLDQRLAALGALEAHLSSHVRAELERLLSEDIEEHLKSAIRDVLQ